MIMWFLFIIFIEVLVEISIIGTFILLSLLVYYSFKWAFNEGLFDEDWEELS